MLPLIIYLFFMCHVNIVSLSKNIDKLEEFLNKFTGKIDIICISETRWTDAKLNSATIPGYQIYCCNSKSMAFKGAARGGAQCHAPRPPLTLTF